MFGSVGIAGYTLALRIIMFALLPSWGMAQRRGDPDGTESRRSQTRPRRDLLCFWAFQIPLAWLLAFRMGLGVNRIFIAIPVAQSALAVAGLLMFRRGKWKGSTV